MGHLIAIVGEPGSGKTCMFKTLDPKTSFYINVDGKPLTFKGAKSSFNAANKNYMVTSSFEDVEGTLGISSLIANISQKAPHIKCIVVDTVSSAMLDTEMRKYSNNGKNTNMTQSQWYDLAKDCHNLIKDVQRFVREDLFVFFLFHQQVGDDGLRDILTNGRKLEKIQVTGMFNNCFFINVDTAGKRYLTTTNDGTAKAKSYEDLFPVDQEVPLDANYIMDTINKWE